MKRQTELAGWELNTITIEIILFSGIVMGIITGLGPRFASFKLPSYVWFAIGFGCLGLLLIPLQSVLARTRQEGTLSIRRAVEGVVIGTVMAAMVMWLLS
jgi:hypothetical protein